MKIELDFLHALQGLHNPIFDRIMLFITRLGDGNFIWLLISISMILLPPIKKVFNKEYDDEYMNNVRKRRNVGVTIIIALLLSIILVNICMKPLFGRLRPFQVDSTFQVDTDSVSVQKLGDSSFPSGHTSAAFAAAGMVAIILACLIAFSRMYFFVHFPTDIIGGVVAGIICGKVASVFVEKMDKQI